MKKKLLALTLVVILALTAVIGGTLAYFTDNDQATNTFTVGKVDLTLTEDVGTNEDHPDWLPGTSKEGGADYQVLPGVTYAKNVDIKLESGSAESYVFVELNFKNISSLWNISETDDDRSMLGNLLVNPDTSIFNGKYFEANKVGAKYDETTDTYSEVYYCGTKVAEETIHLFDAVKVPAELEDQTIPAFAFNIKAYAIQKAGVPDVATAYNELNFAGMGFVEDPFA